MSSGMRRLLRLAPLGVLVLAATADARPITSGRYRLHDHPDGALRPPTYGLRLDGLDGDSSHDFTFTFDHADAEMYLDYDADGGTIHIFGTMYGGRDMGAAYSTNPNEVGLWEVDFTYTTGVRELAGDDDVVAGPGPASNLGTLVRLFGDEQAALDASYTLNDYPPHYDWTFRFGDESNDLGHRGFDGLSGWGWLNHSGYQGHVNSSDWLFTAEFVPEPTAGLLGVIGLGATATMRRRRI